MEFSSDVAQQKFHPDINYYFLKSRIQYFFLENLANDIFKDHNHLSGIFWWKIDNLFII